MKQPVVSALRGFIVVALGSLLLTQVVVLPWVAHTMAVDAPAFASLRVPLLAVSIAVIASGQAVLISTWRLLTMTQVRDVFSAAALPWVDAIIVALAAAGALGVGTGVWFGTLTAAGPITVIVMPVILGGACGAAALLMTVMRSLLVQATAQRTELAAVV